MWKFYRQRVDVLYAVRDYEVELLMVKEGSSMGHQGLKTERTTWMNLGNTPTTNGFHDLRKSCTAWSICLLEMCLSVSFIIKDQHSEGVPNINEAIDAVTFMSQYP